MENNMDIKQVRNQLMMLLWMSVGIAIVLVVVFESGLFETGVLAGISANVEFVLVTLMELLTIALIPLSMRLFKFKRIHNELVEKKAEGLQKWGVVRLAMLLDPMVINTLFYYLYMNTSFGYMAIIGLLCLPFVYPSLGRCLSEIESPEA